MRLHHRITAVLGTATTLCVLGAAPATADDGDLDSLVAAVRDAYTGGAGSAVPRTGSNEFSVSSEDGTVTGTCKYVLSLPSTSLATMTVAVSYTVHADRAAVAVNGLCEIKDANVSYGAVAAAAPGSEATNATYLTVPRTASLWTCNTPEALWFTGTEANPGNESSCRPA
jgi:hypothetical protein